MSNLYVLACINGHPPSESVIDYSSWLAKTMNSGLKLFHAIDNQFHDNSADLSGSIGLGAREDLLAEIVKIEHEQNKLLQQKSKLILESAKLYAEKSGIKDLKVCLRKGRVLDNILDFKNDLSMAVIGKYGKNHQGMSSKKSPIGHKVESIVKKVHLPILIVSEPFIEPKSITLSYDGSVGAIKVLDFLSTNFKGSLINFEVVYFGEDNEKNQKMLLVAKDKLAKSGFKVELKIITESTEDSLPNYLANSKSDILAMGAFGHGVLHDIFVGSFTLKMIQKSSKPILLVR